MKRAVSRRWAVALLAVLAVVAATLSLAAPASLADGCNSPSRNSDLSLTGSAAPAAPNVNYTIVVTNNGPDCTNGVTATLQLAPGSTFVGFVGSDRNWLCSGGNVVDCSLQSTLPSPPGNNVTFFTVAATPPSSPSTATVHASVASSAAQDPPTNNETWISFGKANKTGTRSGQHPQVDIVRFDPQSIATNLLDPASFPAPPAGYTPSTDLVLLVVTPPAPGGSKKQVITVTFTFNAPSKPSASILVLNHGSNAWELVTQKCGGNGPYPCIDSVAWDQQTGVATLVYLTLHFSHLHK